MNEIAKKVFDKLSAYDIFNNLYPGIVFCYALKFILNIDILTDQWFENIVLFYFIGMIIGRIGSVVIEELLKNIKVKEKGTQTKVPLLNFANHEDYGKACRVKPLIVELSSVNNTYRNLLSTFVCLLFCKAYICISNLIGLYECPVAGEILQWISIIALIILFLCSYIKQTKYVVKNVKENLHE